MPISVADLMSEDPSVTTRIAAGRLSETAEMMMSLVIFYQIIGTKSDCS